jgi:hypothetical protein
LIETRVGDLQGDVVLPDATLVAGAEGLNRRMRV